jgi:hypothetical protein
MAVHRRHLPLALLLVAIGGCASTPPAPSAAAAAAPAAPLPRSSIAAVLAHRNELKLSAEQETRLGAAEAELEVAIEKLMRERHVPPPDARPPPTRSTGPGAPQMGAPMPGTPGGAGSPGMSSMPGMSGSYSGGHGNLSPATGLAPAGATPPLPQGVPPTGAAPRAAPSPQAQLNQRLDDLDTAAWLKVEAVLSPSQQEQAREFASDYRAARFEARQQEGAAR